MGKTVVGNYWEIIPWELKELGGVKGVKDKWGCSLDGAPWS